MLLKRMEPPWMQGPQACMIADRLPHGLIFQMPVILVNHGGRTAPRRFIHRRPVKVDPIRGEHADRSQPAVFRAAGDI